MVVIALKIAEYIITKCTLDKCPVSNLQLQKILYLLQHNFLQKHNASLFDNDFEAWQFGPVIPSVYSRYCGFGSMPINLTYHNKISAFENIEDIDNIIIKTRNLKPWDFKYSIYSPGGAWSKIYSDGLGDHQIIPKDLIQKDIFADIV